MTCYFVSCRPEFVAVLAEKLGPEFTLHAIDSTDMNTGDISNLHGDAFLVYLPDPKHAEFSIHFDQLKRVLNAHSTPVIAFTATPDQGVMLKALAAGAYDCFAESGSLAELRIVLRRAMQFQELKREVVRLREAAEGRLASFASIVGSDRTMHALFSLASKVAPTDATVLLQGESGTGKELLARALHEASPRARHPFVAVACSSLPESLIEAELFGHERGAFTGAVALRKGRFECAGQGTIFLDEIGELSQNLQAKLLRVLQERRFERIGSSASLPFHARVICATNRDLKEMVRIGGFRLDLYYRLNTIEMRLPALRDRRGDIALLAQTFLTQFAERYGKQVRRMHPTALYLLEEYSWPGNVRELQNTMERAVVLCEGQEISTDHLPFDLVQDFIVDPARSLENEVRDFKRRLIQRALLESGNNKVQAARSLGIARSSLHRLIEELHIEQQQQQQKESQSPLSLMN